MIWGVQPLVPWRTSRAGTGTAEDSGDAGVTQQSRFAAAAVSRRADGGVWES